MKLINVYLNFYQLIAIGWGQRVAHIKAVSNELQQVTLRAVASESESCDGIVSSQSQQFCAGADTGSKGKKEVRTK